LPTLCRCVLKLKGFRRDIIYFSVSELAETKEETQTMRNVKIDMKKCTNCRECIEVCPEEVFQLVDGIPTHVFKEKCIECDLCVNICPEGAISIVTA
jgi:ferredoxin